MLKLLKDIAKIVEGELCGDGKTKIIGLADIKNARSGELIFALPTHLEEAEKSEASAIIVSRDVRKISKPAIKVDNPRAAFFKLIDVFIPKLKISQGISPKAHIGQDVKIAAGATIMPYAVIDDHTEIGNNVIICPHVYIGQHSSIGDSSIIYSNVTIRENCKIGRGCIIHSSTVIGADGFGFATVDHIHKKIPQIGNVIIGDNVEIGAHVGIDRATMGSTIIGNGTKIDNLVHIAHNCRIGDNCLIVAQTGIAGSTTVGDNVTFGGQVGTVGHIKIGANSTYAARSGITKNMPENFLGSGFPVQLHRESLKTQAMIKKIPVLFEKIQQLERELKNLLNSKQC